jgi:hypothetical protein
MSATPRRLALGLLVALLGLPATPAGAVPLDTSVVLGKLRGFLSAIWEEVGCQIDPWGACAPYLEDHGCELELAGRCRAAATLVSEGSQKPILGENGCEIDPLGRCGN